MRFAPLGAGDAAGRGRAVVSTPAPSSRPDSREHAETVRENAMSLFRDKDGEQWAEAHEITDQASPDLRAARDVLALLAEVERLECERDEALRFALEHAKKAWWANAISDDGQPLGDYPPDKFNEGQARLQASLAVGGQENPA